jgi:O-antigen/teichoic acid export membrane protein
MNNKNSLSGPVVWYGLGNLFVRSLSFILLPLYSNLISTIEFGDYSLLMSVYAILQVFFQFGMFGALNKFYIEEKSDEKKALIFSSILNSIIIIGISFTIMLWFFSTYISYSVFSTSNFKDLLILTSFALLFETVAFYILSLLKTMGRPRMVVIFSSIGAVLNLLLNIIFVYYLKLSVLGIILAQLISGIILLIILLPMIKNAYLFKIDKNILNIVFKFSFPLLLANLCMAGSNVADRFILNIYSGREQVGIYSFSYRIALIMSIFITSFITAWNPFSLNLYHSSEYKLRFGTVFNKLIAASCLVLIIVTLFADTLFDINMLGIHFFNSNYRSGIVIIPIVMIGYIFNGISSYYSVYPTVSNKSYHLLISEFLAFSTNVLFNIILIPLLGIIGAALSTAAGFLVGCLYLFFVSKKKIIIEYRIKDLTIIISSALIFLLLGLYFNKILAGIFLTLLYLFVLHYFTKIKINRLLRIF